MKLSMKKKRSQTVWVRRINVVGLCCLSSNNKKKHTLPNLRQFTSVHVPIWSLSRGSYGSRIISFMHFWNGKYGNFFVFLVCKATDTMKGLLCEPSYYGKHYVVWTARSHQNCEMHDITDLFIWILFFFSPKIPYTFNFMVKIAITICL